ncbi:TetR family transcriptional regulator [Modestobacter marinus]|uniref:TetR family transcriptional regulator n=1 Tax=Modestobacter marinus TaxID=477641 RepID=A0ABQ2FT98_9ACTN|nr:TetR family transcriptional regulator [Modestobacter marinus]
MFERDERPTVSETRRIGDGKSVSCDRSGGVQYRPPVGTAPEEHGDTLHGGRGEARRGSGGRRRDASLDAVILSAAYDVLADAGYEDMTISAVAARAGAGKATLYRRWPTKESLVLAVVAHIGRPPEEQELPDTGDLRTDLLALVDSAWLGGPASRLRGLRGLTSAALHSPRLADALRRQVVDPYTEAYRALLQRAADRGEIAPPTDIAVLAEVVPALATHWLMFGATPPTRASFETAVDQVLLAACRPGR